LVFKRQIFLIAKYSLFLSSYLLTFFVTHLASLKLKGVEFTEEEDWRLCD